MIALLLALNFSVAVSAPHATIRDARFLNGVVERVASRVPMSTAQLGVVVEEASTGRRLVMRQANREFAPASNFKLLDAATALAYIGPTYRMRTTLLSRGTIVGGILQGDLILVGGGDPVLSRADLRGAAASVAAAGIGSVAGSILIDGSAFDGQRYGSGWAWDDMPYYYQPPIQALSVDEGTVAVTVSPGDRIGDPVSATFEPDPGMMLLRSIATTAAAKAEDDADCFRQDGSTTIIIVGHLPIGHAPDTLDCAVDDSLDDAAAVFRQTLNDAHVSVGTTPLGPPAPNVERDFGDSGRAPAPLGDRYASATLLWSHDSPTLAQLIHRMMPPSDNFIAEHLFKTLPIAAYGQRGSFDGGAAVERAFIASLGLDPHSIDNGDGSGLSQGDRITPFDLAEILRWETRSSTGSVFVDSLARAGLEGTVKRHLKGTDAIGRVKAKDGYIWHVTTISGYAITKRHGLMIFSIMFNDVNGLLRPFYAAEDEIIRAIVDMP